MKKSEKRNITQLNSYSNEKTLENIRQQKRKRFVRVRTSIILVVGIISIGLASIPLVKTMRATDEFETMHAQAQDQLETLEEEQASLEYQVALLEDEEYVAKLARQELNVSLENEILINLPEENPESEKDLDDPVIRERVRQSMTKW